MNVKVYEGIWGQMSESEKTLCMLADHVEQWWDGKWEEIDKGYTPDDGDVLSWYNEPKEEE